MHERDWHLIDGNALISFKYGERVRVAHRGLRAP
jgi:hypothetical protein